MSVGDKPLQAVREIPQLSDKTHNSKRPDFKTVRPYTIERVSQTPPIYILRNFVTQGEAESIAKSAYLGGTMEQAETASVNGQLSRPNSTT
eukprot:CAMPEP_0178929960 /NCGR_PEP_ID=MMETSP0786-20121207/20943_1 /TAXON_ID=186022 /ORGANISM="Thalassionema frauenfeldii, Strain CCMP 1798" /LENGTH=90 /DNA_ID=CAMNT_0020606381 /DNA_START=174 /DNA_END=442 /DNA_ORIENTATION=+